jgi:hypothetical protein
MGHRIIYMKSNIFLSFDGAVVSVRRKWEEVTQAGVNHHQPTHASAAHSARVQISQTP